MPGKHKKQAQKETVQFLLRLPYHDAVTIKARADERNQYTTHVVLDLLREILTLKDKYGENVEMGMFERIKAGGI